MCCAPRRTRRGTCTSWRPASARVPRRWRPWPGGPTRRIARSGAAEAFADRLAALPAGERKRLLVELVRTEAAVVLGRQPGDRLADDVAFRQLGFDSLTAVELRNRLTSATGLALPNTMVFDYPTPVALAEYIGTELFGGQPTHAVVAASPIGTDEPVAIAGIACRFPGGVSTPDDLWRLPVDGMDAIGPVPQGRG